MLLIVRLGYHTILFLVHAKVEMCDEEDSLYTVILLHIVGECIMLYDFVTRVGFVSSSEGIMTVTVAMI